MTDYAIQDVICDCGKHMILDIETPDIYNSDFYNSRYICSDDCKNIIKITTKEMRD